MESVKNAMEKVIDTDHEYFGPARSDQFNESVVQLTLGKDSSAIEEERIASMQTIGSTGGLKLLLEFVKRFWDGDRTINIVTPSCVNYKYIIKDAGLTFNELPYYQPNTKDIDAPKFLETVKALPRNSVLLLQDVGHNPTGLDLPYGDYVELCDICATRQNLVLFDCTYHGLVSSDVAEDAKIVRYFVEQQNMVGFVNSFSSNMGVPGHRVGSMSIVCDSAIEKFRYLSHLKPLAGSMWLLPPALGTKVVQTVLNTPGLERQWSTELGLLVGHCAKARRSLTERLKVFGSRHDWRHIQRQVGLYAYTGLSPEIVENLINTKNLFMPLDGRIFLPAVTPQNLDYIADAIENATRNLRRDSF